MFMVGNSWRTCKVICIKEIIKTIGYTTWGITMTFWGKLSLYQVKDSQGNIWRISLTNTVSNDKSYADTYLGKHVFSYLEHNNHRYFYICQINMLTWQMRIKYVLSNEHIVHHNTWFLSTLYVIAKQYAISCYSSCYTCTGNLMRIYFLSGKH